MADANKSDLPNVDDIQKAMEKQIAELRKEITKINKSISARGAEMLDDASEQASDFYETASARASRTAQQLRSQAQVVSEAARENPGTTTAVVGVIGLLGFLAGLAIGQSMNDTSRRWY
jgi:cell division septum initiation protein DivIVA